MEISVFHNMIFTANLDSNILIFWHYEYMRINGILEFGENEFINAIEVINGHGVKNINIFKINNYFNTILFYY